MPQPTKYEITRDFSQDESNSVAGRSTVLTAGLDAELANIASSIEQIIDNLGLIQRDDGEVANLSIGIDQLKTELSFGFNAATDWATATDYALRDSVWEAEALYYCTEAHTSGTFADDLAAGKWSLIMDLEPYITAAQDAQTGAETAETGAVSAKNAAEAAQSGAESAEAGAVAAYDSFDDRYLGAKSSNPATDNDGDALITGALYWNTTAGELRVYNGGSWDTIPTKANKDDATAAPTVNDDSSANYGVGSWWVDVSNDEMYVCLDAAVGAAVWEKITKTLEETHATDTSTSTQYKPVVTDAVLYLEEL